MATETLDAKASHIRSITVTSVATLSGILAGILSGMVASSATDMTGLAVYAVLAFTQLGVMRLLGIEVAEFGAKDNLYVFFMTFALWFISWGILLTTGSV